MDVQANKKHPWRADVVAGLSVIGLLIPEAVAYASLAGMPAQAGLVALACGLLCYGLLGSSRFAVVSATSSSAVVLAAALTTLLPVAGGVDRALLAMLLVLGAGLWFLFGALLGLGKIANFVAMPVLRGVTMGLAVVIALSQLPKVFGLAGVNGAAWSGIYYFFSSFSQWHWPSVVVGGTALCILFCWRSTRQPVALWVIVLAILAALVLPFPRWGIAVVGDISFAVSWPQWQQTAFVPWLLLLQLSGALAMMIYAESYSSINTYALRNNDVIRPNRDLCALGVGNVVAALAGGLAVGAGFSATSANVAAGAQSKWSMHFALMALVFTLMFLLPYVGYIPQAVLAAIVIHAVSRGLSWQPVLPYFKWRRDRLLVLAAFGAVVVLGVLNGLMVAVGLSIALTLLRFASPKVSILGRLGRSHDYVNISRFPEAAVPPKIFIVRIDGPLFFANAESMIKSIQDQLVQYRLLHAVEAVLVSMEEVPDLDGTSIEVLNQLAVRLAAAGIELYLCRVHQRVQSVLLRAQLDGLPESRVSSLSVDSMVGRIAGKNWSITADGA